jgi:hypothetical protein
MALLTKQDGAVVVDHSASPGISENDIYERGWQDQGVVAVPEGRKMEIPTLGCWHCGATVVLNPLRTRERSWCFQCNRYICDLCKSMMAAPQYVHRSWQELVDLVQAGKPLERNLDV